MARGLPTGGATGRRAPNLTPAQGRGFSARVEGMAGWLATIERYSDNVGNINRDIVNGVALTCKTVINRAYDVDIGPGRMMAHFGQKGARVGARYDVKGKINAVAIIRPLPPGPATINEWGAYKKPGGYWIAKRVAPRPKGSPRRSRRDIQQERFSAHFGGILASRERNFLAISPVRHPGPRAKHTFEKVSDRLIPISRELWQRESLRQHVALLAS